VRAQHRSGPLHLCMADDKSNEDNAEGLCERRLDVSQ
jgi:hypothetical protein